MKTWKALELGLKNCNLLIIINNILTNSNEAEKERIKMNIKETESKNITSENPVNDRIVKITGKFMKENQNNFKLKDRSEVFLNRKKDLKIDAFTHILTPNFFKDIKELNPKIPQMFGTLINEPLVNVDTRRKYHSEYSDVKEIISMINFNPEDFTKDREKTYEITRKANEELIETVKDNSDLFVGAVGMVPMNNVDGAVKIINEQVGKNKEMFGIQLFSKALGKSIASDEYLPIFEAVAKNDVVIFLHPVYDMSKNDNNIVFSWEYEQTQAMNEIVMAGIFKKYPNIKILVHHAGAMVPFFANRLPLVMPKEYADDFKKFYVDTAIIGNTKAVDMAIDYFGEDKVIFATDAPVGMQPAGATVDVIESIENLNVSDTTRYKIYRKNLENILNVKFD